MFKRPASTPTTAQMRKRRKNGVTTSRTVLEPVETPPALTQGMRVWHINVKEPRVVRKSVIPLQPEVAGVQLEDQALDQVEAVTVEAGTGVGGKRKRKKRTRKRANDSVSPLNLHSW